MAGQVGAGHQAARVLGRGLGEQGAQFGARGHSESHLAEAEDRRPHGHRRRHHGRHRRGDRLQVRVGRPVGTLGEEEPFRGGDEGNVGPIAASGFIHVTRQRDAGLGIADDDRRAERADVTHDALAPDFRVQTESHRVTDLLRHGNRLGVPLDVVVERVAAEHGFHLDILLLFSIHQGLHQRCWVHFLRDVHDLKEQHAHDEQLFTWAKTVKAIYEQAVAWVEEGADQNPSPHKQQQARVAQQHAFQEQLWQVCQPYVRTPAPQHTLCERVERFLPELFVFVAIPGVPAHNNLAERSVRPLVVARKISGGTRSPKGSETRMGLASLFGTWTAQHLNPFHQCLATLTLKSSFGQV